MSVLSNNNNICGYVADGWETVKNAFEQNFIDGLDVGASLSIYHRGKCVIDLYGGWKDPETKEESYTADTLQVVFSTSKGVLSAAVALCVERGWLDYHTPIVKYWPEFGANGKEDILLGDVLSHRAGLPYVNQVLSTADVCDWSRMISLLANEKPQWEPGSAHGYHGHTTGYIAGELIRRVDPQHRSFGQFVREEIDREYYVGIFNEETDRRVAPLFEKPIEKITDDSEATKTLTCNGGLPLNQSKMIYNESRVHQAELPAVNGITNARTLARIYSLLIGDVDEHGQKLPRLVTKATLSEAIEDVTPNGEPDRTLYNMLTSFSRGGFQVYGDSFQVLGEGAFGHTGYGGSCAFAYLPSQLSYAYVCNQLDPLSLTVDVRSARIIRVIKRILERF